MRTRLFIATEVSNEHIVKSSLIVDIQIQCMHRSQAFRTGFEPATESRCRASGEHVTDFLGNIANGDLNRHVRVLTAFAAASKLHEFD